MRADLDYHARDFSFASHGDRFHPIRKFLHFVIFTRIYSFIARHNEYIL